MRNKLVLVAILCVFAGNAWAQNMQFGVQFNPLLSWYNSKNSSMDRNGLHLGLQGGLDFDNYFSDRYAFNTGIFLGSAGGKLKLKGAESREFASSIIAPGSSLDINYRTLTIPIGLKFKTEEIGYVTIYGKVGINTQFVLNSEASSSDGVLNNESFSSEIWPINMGYYIGGGMEYAVTRTSAIVIGLSYNGFAFDSFKQSEYKIIPAYLLLNLGFRF